MRGRSEEAGASQRPALHRDFAEEESGTGERHDGSEVGHCERVGTTSKANRQPVLSGKL